MDDTNRTWWLDEPVRRTTDALQHNEADDHTILTAPIDPAAPETS